MYSTITGDIVNSRAVSDPAIWAEPLKKQLQRFGTTPTEWEIYRGDSFQLALYTEDALRATLLIKAAIKKVEEAKLDVRLAIGVGIDGRNISSVSESMGDSFVYSGELLDQLKNDKVHLGIKSPWPDFDKEMNMMFKLTLVIINSWTSNSAEVAELIFSVPGITQQKIAATIGIAQSSVNDRIKRGSIYEIVELEKYYRERVSEFMNNYKRNK
ncbi:hypothetical protein BH23BAC3_BH23BAC3_10720 [soil metagenome]